MDAEVKVFKDPVHGQISLDLLLVKLIDTKQFQRLRDIKQLGPVYYVYPGASHNRFEHSIGVCHLARQMLKNLRRKHGNAFQDRNEGTEPDTRVAYKDEMCVLIAALCHELGQGPMSHLYQDLFIRKFRSTWKHVEASTSMFDYLIEDNLAVLQKHFQRFNIDTDPQSSDMIFIKELIYGGSLPGSEKRRGRPLPEHWFLYEIVSNQETGIDVDKMDYIMRDCHGLGVQHSCDWQRFMANTRLIKASDGNVHICTREKEALDLYELFQVRDKLFRVAYQHKTKRAVEYMMAEALKKADPHIKLTGFEGEVKMSEAIDDMRAFTELTDAIFYRIKYSREKELQEARQILERVERRELYWCIGRSLPNENPITTPEMDIPKVVIDLMNVDSGIQPDHLLVDIVTFNYGKGEKNPIDQVWFYHKLQPNVAVRIKQEQVSEMLPKTFEEHEIRLYLKRSLPQESVDQGLKEKLSRAFDTFCQQNGYRTPAGANAISS